MPTCTWTIKHYRKSTVFRSLLALCSSMEDEQEICKFVYSFIGVHWSAAIATAQRRTEFSRSWRVGIRHSAEPDHVRFEGEISTSVDQYLWYLSENPYDAIQYKRLQTFSSEICSLPAMFSIALIFHFNNSLVLWKRLVWCSYSAKNFRRTFLVLEYLRYACSTERN